MKRWLPVIVSAQVALLIPELAFHYDSLQREIALVITNVIGTTLLVLFQRWLRRRGSSLSVVTMILIAGAIWLDALGNFQHLYGQFWWWDRVTHVVGGMAISGGFIDFYQAWRRTEKLNVTWGQATWLGFLVGQFLGAMYEVSEYLGDWWFHTARVRGPYDTPHDLLNNAIGGALVVLILRWVQRKTKVAAR